MLTESKSWFVGGITLIGMWLSGWLLLTLSPVITPFVLALALSYIFEPLVDVMALKLRSRGLSVMLLYLCLGLVGILIAGSIVPKLQVEIVDLFTRIPKWCEWLVEVGLPQIDAWFGTALGQSALPNIQETLIQTLPNSSRFVKEFWQWAFDSGWAIMVFCTQMAMVLLVTYYCMRDWHIILSQYEKLMPKAYHDKSIAFIKEADGVFRTFIVGQLSIMLILGLGYTVLLWCLSVPFATMIGLLSGLLSIFPNLGSAVGMVLAFVVLMAQKATFAHIAVVLGLFVFGHLLESFYLSPKLVGDKLGLHPIMVMFAVMAGGQLLGFIGVLVALPMMAILLTCMQRKLVSTD